MPKVHNFKDSLANSNEAVDLPLWGEIYRQAFSGFATMHSVRGDGWAQKGGIDRVVILGSGKTLYIDEKFRKDDWPDILLERWSDNKKKTPGWIQKELACDYIAYAMKPSKRCYLLPFQQLRKAWKDHGRGWVEDYDPVFADNKSYITESVPVPIDTLLAALSDAMLARWTS